MSKLNAFIIFFLTMLCLSCNKEIELTHIVLKNESGTILSVQLFPKSAYLRESSDFYRWSYNNAGSSETAYELGFDTLNSVTWDLLYLSNDLSIAPCDLLAEVFDSIHVLVPTESDSLLLRFTPSEVSGYSKNMFTDVSGWKYELNYYDYPTQITNTRETAHEYFFIIREENIVSD